MLPEELPILFSNKHLYYFFTSEKTGSFFSLSKISESIPYTFTIPKNEEEKRNIGLLHPLAQLQTFSYIMKYDTMITNFCKKSSFSVRSPIKRNIPKIEKNDFIEKNIKKVNDEYNLTNNKQITTEEVNGYYSRYFSYNKFVKISKLYDSPEFTRDKLTFNYFLMVDIQNFFPSIYTHSLSWAIYGNKALGKEYRNEETFANATDKINQRINFNETNGLIVGPEFSRVIAEVLLTRIDLNIEHELNKKQLYINKDYKIYRYVDDYYIFANQPDIITKIEKKLQKNLQDYNLNQNVSKREIQTKPIITGSASISKLKGIFSDFDIKRSLLFTELKVSKPKQNLDLKKDETIGTKYIWKSLYENANNIIIENTEDKYKLVKYFLRVIPSKIPAKLSLNRKTKVIIKEIIEIISNIYVLAITTDNTNYLLQSYVKIFNLIDENKDIDINVKEEINEYMFQRLFFILTTNFSEFDSMYDILIFMRMLNNKIPAYFLSEILDVYDKNYFVMCSVAKYLLNDENNKIDKGFKTVENKLNNVINSYFKNYKTKGLKYNIYDGEYYYILNDFSKYPGFNNTLKSKLRIKLSDEINEELKNDKEIFEKISKYSFYNWGDSSDTFIKKLIKKSSYVINKNNDVY